MNVPNNKYIITIKNNKVSMSATNKMNILDLIQTLATVQLGAMNDILSQVSEPDKESVKADLYDRANFAASSLLHMFAPDYDRNPDLTTRAIMKAENEIIDSDLKAVESKSKKTPGLKVIK